jgi:YD repeat-containing protein
VAGKDWGIIAKGANSAPEDSGTRLTSSIDPESNTVTSTGATLATTYNYDANGNLISKIATHQLGLDKSLVYR